MIGRSVLMSIALAAVVGLAAAPALAQSSSSAPKRTGWQFEFHGGSTSPGTESKVITSALPQAGPTFADFRGGQSRLVPSWFFGDGANLANQVTAQTGDGVSIVALDPVLTAAAANFKKGGSYGLRIGHTITSHVLFEFDYESFKSDIVLDPGAVAAANATVASFAPYWTALLTRPGTTNVQANAQSTIASGKSNAKFLLGEVAINVVSIGKWTPYLELGGGLELPTAATDASIALTGHYQVQTRQTGGPVLSETDQVLVRFQARAPIVKVIGGGVEGYLWKSLGVRADLRAVLGGADFRTRLDTQPQANLTAPSGVLARAFMPSLQIASNGLPTSMSLPGVNHFFSFEGVGRLTLLSVGAFVRF